MRTLLKTRMHIINNHTHKITGSGMPVNGGDRRSGSITYGGTREVDIGVPTGALATIFVKDGNSKKTANQNEPQQQTSQEKRKPTEKS